MKIQKIEIYNYRSLKKVTIYPNNVMALIGRNNSGKSNVIRALQLFFESSIRLVDKECFFNEDDKMSIEIVIKFNQLSEWEQENFKPWLYDDDLIVGKKISCEDNSFSIENFAVVKSPELEWLSHDIISGNKIAEWWPIKSTLKIGDLDFGATLGTRKPGVGFWKDRAADFIKSNDKEIPWIEKKVDNPKGYGGVLKGTLPNFILIPAVKDVTEEAKITKTNPFGRLLNSVLEKITAEKLEIISEKLKEINEQINRTENKDRIKVITEFEDRVNVLMKEIMDCDVEINIPLPEVREIFSDAKIFVDDGIRTSIESKGHGMQRSMILTILRAYAELINKIAIEGGVEYRSTIFAIEEPELFLHPQAQRTLYTVLRLISKGIDQIVYSTQSSVFVDIGYFDDVCVMRREKVEGEFQSLPTQLFMSTMLTDLKARKGVDGTEEGIRELYYNAFNPMINEGFFADKVVIVEGPSELYSLPIYGNTYGYDFDKNNVSVVHSDGKGQMDRLFRVFNGFKIPSYLIFDGDKNHEDKPIKDKTIELLQLLEDPIENIEDLETRVKDEYAVFDTKYEDQLKLEIDEYEEYIKAAKESLGPVGKPLLHKFIANKIKEKLVEGRTPNEILPETINKIINKIKVLKYNKCILRK